MSALAIAPEAGTGYEPAVMTGVDRAIRVSTAVAVLAVAGVAAYVSYWHAYAVVCAHGESGITARLEPATIDGLVYASSMVNLYAARHRLPVLLPDAQDKRGGVTVDEHRVCAFQAFRRVVCSRCRRVAHGGGARGAGIAWMSLACAAGPGEGMGMPGTGPGG